MKKTLSEFHFLSKVEKK